MAQTFSAPKDDQERPYTLLSIGGHALLLPQSEIRILAPIQDIKIVSQCASGVVGWLPFAGRRWPVYCLDEALHPLPYLPSGQRICALVKLNASLFWSRLRARGYGTGSALRIGPSPRPWPCQTHPSRG